MSPTIKWQPILPIIPKLDTVITELEKEFESVGRDILLDFELSTATWTHQPKFEIIRSSRGFDRVMEIGTDDDLYALVSKGAPPHVIVPHGNYFLRFQSGYKAKTAPGRIASVKGGKFGAFVRAEAVNHPGFEPRDFESTMQKEWEDKFSDRMDKALDRAIRAAQI